MDLALIRLRERSTSHPLEVNQAAGSFGLKVVGSLVRVLRLIRSLSISASAVPLFTDIIHPF